MTVNELLTELGFSTSNHDESVREALKELIEARRELAFQTFLRKNHEHDNQGTYV